MDVKNVKGTHDVYLEESDAYSAIEGLMRSIAMVYGYKEIRTPVMEYTEVFSRGVGNSSDVVRKEMYTFNDKAERSVTLRPEFTAGVMRAVVQNKLYATNELPLKLFYCGPAFRYERPQLGRYRQFNQFGIESIGNNSPYNDVECIALAYTILQSLGLENVTIKINSLGDEESRNNYRTALKNYFAGHIENMCEDCKSRFELNPLRILDCKVPDDRPIIDNAPKVNDYLTDASRERFSKVLSALESLGIPYEVDGGLVRGLDYYSEVVFELQYVSQKGNDYGAIGGGGHYGKLMKELGGPDLPGVGFSFGIERLYSILNDDGLLPDLDEGLDFYVMPLEEKVQEYAQAVAFTLRSNGYVVDYCFDQVKMGNMFKRAANKKAKYAVIIGGNEMDNNTVIVKDLAKQEQVVYGIDELVEKMDVIFDRLDECECENGGECCCGNKKGE